MKDSRMIRRKRSSVSIDDADGEPGGALRVAGQALIILALVFSPLAFGAVEPWSVSVLAVLSFSALACALGLWIVTGEARGLANPFLVPLVLGLLLVEVQLLPWPQGLLRLVSPRAYEAHNTAQQATGVVLSFRPSMHPYATFRALVRFGAYVALFAATLRLVVSRRDVTRLATVILAVGFLVGLEGIVQNLAGTRKIYGWRVLARGGALFGPFVSRNQFAAYAGICFFMGAAVLLGRLGRRSEDGDSWAGRMRESFSERTAQSLLLAFAIALIGASVFWSLSRGGILSLLLAVGGMLMMMAMSHAGDKMLYVVGGLVLMAAWVTYLGWEPVIERLGTLEQVSENMGTDWRMVMIKDAARMGLMWPLLGVGAGSFRSVYPNWGTVPTSMSVPSPHNEYMHVFAEMGVPGLVLSAAALCIFAVIVWRGFRAAGPWGRGFLAGGVGAVLAPVLHSVVDFPMRSPAIAATFAVVLALVMRGAQLAGEGPAVDPVEPEKVSITSSSGRRRVRRRRKTLHHSMERWSLPEENGGARGRRGLTSVGVVGLVAVGVAWLLACNMALDPMRGELLGRRVRRVNKQLEISHVQVDVAEVLNSVESAALRSVPEYAHLYVMMGDLAIDGASVAPRVQQSIDLGLRAVQLRKMAVRLEPLNYKHYRDLARAYLRFRRYELAAVHAEHVFDMTPYDPKTWARVAGDFSRYGDQVRAREYLKRAEALTEEHSVKGAERELKDARDTIEENGQP